MATVIIPTPLRKFTGNSAKINVSGNDVSEIIANLVHQYPDVQKHLLDPSGSVRSFINVFVDEDDIRNLQYNHTHVETRSVISIVPAIAGGNLI
ncbi:MoaD [Arcticibacter svalbardensis MN12-7]|uniref:MoaD n=1 Tax=Arcticibacter svalbardensis MN12-7 TaxID=1150600 RepID=R9GT60_9SPHI|nr:MoaD/ThiS family protein [Arcticibacter svalbardensis]EOR94878.1 MoaD [Arcticibacter svalbardensis MN12-7]